MNTENNNNGTSAPKVLTFTKAKEAFIINWSTLETSNQFIAGLDALLAMARRDAITIDDTASDNNQFGKAFGITEQRLEQLLEGVEKIIKEHPKESVVRMLRHLSLICENVNEVSFFAINIFNYIREISKMKKQKEELISMLEKVMGGEKENKGDRDETMPSHLKGLMELLAGKSGNWEIPGA